MDLKSLIDNFLYDLTPEEQENVIHKLEREDEAAARILKNLRRMQKRGKKAKQIAKDIDDILN